MLIHDGLAPLDPPARQAGVRLLDGRVRRAQAVQTLLEERAEPVVGLGRVHEERVAARRRLVQDVEEGRARRLLLVRHVRVPGYGRRAVREEGVHAVVARSAVHEVDLGVAGWCARGRVDVVAE
jgi:hypothetical protein